MREEEREPAREGAEAALGATEADRVDIEEEHPVLGGPRRGVASARQVFAGMPRRRPGRRAGDRRGGRRGCRRRTGAEPYGTISKGSRGRCGGDRS
jgi:hypothetical protein